MQQPLQITFRGMDPSAFVAMRVRELAARLERFEDRITSCHVTIQSPHQHQRHGQLFEVKIRMGVPGGEIAVDCGSQNRAHEDLYVALRDAFDAAVRKLERRATSFRLRTTSSRLAPPARDSYPS